MQSFQVPAELKNMLTRGKAQPACVQFFAKAFEYFAEYLKKHGYEPTTLNKSQPSLSIGIYGTPDLVTIWIEMLGSGHIRACRTIDDDHSAWSPTVEEAKRVEFDRIDPTTISDLSAAQKLVAGWIEDSLQFARVPTPPP